METGISTNTVELAESPECSESEVELEAESEKELGRQRTKHKQKNHLHMFQEKWNKQFPWAKKSNMGK